MKRKRDAKFILIDNGEVTEEYPVEDYEIVDSQQARIRRERAERKKQRGLDRRGNFVFIKMDVIEKANLTLMDRSYLLQLLVFTRFDGEPLKLGKKPLSVKDISQIWGISDGVTYKRMNKFVKMKLFKREKHPDDKRKSVYTLNRNSLVMGYLTKKEKDRANYVMIYHNKLQDVIDGLRIMEQNESKQGKKVNRLISLGLLFGLLPYIHYDTYLLVDNPNYPDTKIRDNKMTDSYKFNLLNNPGKELLYLTKKKIGEAAGYKKMNSQTIGKYIDWLIEVGAIAVLNNKKQLRYMVNPELCYRKDDMGKDTYTRHIKDYFNFDMDKYNQHASEVHARDVEIKRIISLLEEPSKYKHNYMAYSSQQMKEAMKVMKEVIDEED